MSSDGPTEDQFAEFKLHYKPIKWCIDPIECQKEDSVRASYRSVACTNVSNVTRHHINLQRVWALLDRPYDAYVITRADLLYKTSVPWQHIVFESPRAKAFIPEGCDYGGLNDQFAICNTEAAKVYCSVYQNTAKMVASGCLMHPETLTLRNFRDHGVVIPRFKLDYSILR